MALKDLLTEALNATPPDNERRRATLQAAIKAVDENPAASDAETLGKLIAERERKAATFTAAGQNDLAKAERAEVDALRALLRVTSPGESAPKKAKPAPASKPAGPADSKPLFSRTQIILGGVILAALIAVGVAYYLMSGSGSDDAVASAAGNQPVSVLKDDHTLGNPNAPVQFVEYAAPSCPVCAHYNATVIPLLKAQYIDTGKVFYVFRVFPLRPADGAAEAIAVCLPKESYFQFIDLLFRNQKSWDPEYGITDVRAGLIKMARIAGMSADKVDQCIANTGEQDHVNAVAQDGESKFNIQGTPTFVIDGQVVQNSDAQWADLATRLNGLLAKKQ